MMRSAKERNEVRRRLITARVAIGDGLSQQEVERRARRYYKHFPKGKYWRIEKGYDDATDKEQNAIAKVLGTHRVALFVVEPEAVAS